MAIFQIYGNIPIKTLLLANENLIQSMGFLQFILKDYFFYVQPFELVQIVLIFFNYHITKLNY
ncbi:hypothetical protein D7Z94_16070 [Ulvibacterium marinum]|uniref:Uncharacterized protein n=1 Tax=Ulvibacterium marinum TaxID=2419782 RepID=A0A3B0C107_9FLAO|nr:hypothetical protein D7Z94_16070 [Ulvibacterium marinum]